MFEDDDDIPWASPEIQRDYEAALGSFILAFNRVDHDLGVVLVQAFDQAGIEILAERFVRRAGFKERLELAKLFSQHPAGTYLKGICVDRLRVLSEHRNTLAHGHFDQNPFDGDFKIVERKKIKEYPAEQIQQLTREIDQIWDSIRLAEAQYIFADVSIEEPRPSSDSRAD
ncbi:MAG: hypothetical protein K2X49_27350 [Acetobacteraceae bacterium]|nr:hypothetical protein [Acetobacteraceae bacterium]